ncbi:MAG: TetR/AcrR family transcriptional regulator [Janthinobacterium lividum]
MPLAPVQPRPCDPTDRRVLRSRRMLIDALGKLLKKRDFNELSVQEIVDEADLTRATFYLHYPDKGALLEAMSTERFGEMLRKRGITSATGGDALYNIALGVCDYLAKALGCPSSLSKMPQDRFVIPVLENLFRQDANTCIPLLDVDVDIFATTLAWAIFGAASRWAQTKDRRPAEQMAKTIELLVKPILLQDASSRITDRGQHQ